MIRKICSYPRLSRYCASPQHTLSHEAMQKLSVGLYEYECPNCGDRSEVRVAVALDDYTFLPKEPPSKFTTYHPGHVLASMVIGDGFRLCAHCGSKTQVTEDDKTPHVFCNSEECEFDQLVQDAASATVKYPSVFGPSGDIEQRIRAFIVGAKSPPPLDEVRRAFEVADRDAKERL